MSVSDTSVVVSWIEQVQDLLEEGAEVTITIDKEGIFFFLTKNLGCYDDLYDIMASHSEPRDLPYDVVNRVKDKNYHYQNR